MCGIEATRRVYFLVKDYWGCAAGWGRIFTTRLPIRGYIFSRVTRMGSQIFGIFEIRKFCKQGFKNRKFRG